MRRAGGTSVLAPPFIGSDPGPAGRIAPALTELATLKPEPAPERPEVSLDLDFGLDLIPESETAWAAGPEEPAVPTLATQDRARPDRPRSGFVDAGLAQPVFSHPDDEIADEHAEANHRTADRLEALGRRLRLEGESALQDVFARGEPLDVALAGVLTAFLRRRP